MRRTLLITALLLGMFIVWAGLGGNILWRHTGRWVIATLNPKVCWTPGPRQPNGLRKALPTGWKKMNDVAVWYKPIGDTTAAAPHRASPHHEGLPR